MVHRPNGVDELARVDLERSGLTLEHAKRLKLKVLSAGETKKLGAEFYEAGALYIPYFDLGGRPTSFYRVRYLEKLPGFAGQLEKPQRYAQPAKSLNEVYLPPLFDKTWEEIAGDTSIEIFITEGEKKAAAACVRGLACVGLGGVDSWRASKRGLDMLPALKRVKWKNRPAVIVYDSDAATNPNVVRAQRQLSRELTEHGALVRVASLPAAKDGSKQGLDDYLVEHGKAALAELLQRSPAFAEADALWELNAEVVYVKDPGIVVVLETRQRLDPGSFVAHTYANRHYLALETNKDGVTVAKKKPLARRWMEWESRHEVERITYKPGAPHIHEGEINMWPGWGCEPKRGDVEPWRRLLDYVFEGASESRTWFERWAAYPLQNPGAKMYTAPVFWSRETGTGKTLLAYMLGAIYGKNFIEIKNKDLKGGFNSWAENRQLVYGDEITGGQARVDADWLKGLISQKSVRINPKFIPEYVVPDHMNYIFSSNHPDALFVEDQDRRYFVHEVVGRPLDRAFYETCDRWLWRREGGVVVGLGPGPSALFHHLLKLDLKDFNARERAPMTAAKRNMITSGKSELGMWVHMLKEDPETLLRGVAGEVAARECDVWQPQQLLRAFDPQGAHRVSFPGMARELVRAGFRLLHDGPIRTTGGVVRLYAVRNMEKWESKNRQEIASHYDKYLGPDAPGKF